MSRLDSMIRRLEAQRDGIAWAATRLSGVAGDIVEIGLGNGRSFDHLRETFPERAIWVIERDPSPHPQSAPSDDHLIVMEAGAGLDHLAERGVRAALVHYDLGVGVPELDDPLAESVSPGIAAVLAPDGVVLSNNALLGLASVEGPSSIASGRYYFYRKAAAPQL